MCALLTVVILWCRLVSLAGAQTNQSTPIEEPSANPRAAVNNADDASGATQPDEAAAAVDLLFQDFGVVLSAARSRQPANMTGAPVSVLTWEDLHYGGYTNVPQALSFVPGVDVLKVDRNRYAVGVRGLHQEFSDRTLILVDGRNASNAIFGGIDFERLPVFLEDLSRVEVVRGPGGAVWGANAFNGVINLIRKTPRETQGVLASTTIDEFGDTFSQLRWGASSGPLAWRLSFGYNDRVSSEDAINNDNFDTRDFSREYRFDGEATYALSDQTTLRFGAGHVHITRGDFPFLSFQPGEDERIDSTTAHAKITRDLDSGAEAIVQWYGTFESVNRPSLWQLSSIDNSLEASLRFAPASGHDLLVGGAARIVRIDSNPNRPESLLDDTVFNEQWLGAYVVDRWRVSDHLTLEGQARIDWYSETSIDWSGRLSAFVSLDDASKHVLRFSAAKAFRAPQSGLQQIATQRVPLPSPPTPPGTFGVVLRRAGELDNEEIWSLEVGYTGKLRDDLTLRIDSYYQRYQNLTGAATFTDPLDLGRTIATIDDLGSASAVGVETELRFKRDNVTLSAWYAFNEFDFRGDSLQNARAFQPARHKAGVTARVSLTDWLTAVVNYRFTGLTPVEVFTKAVQPHHRLDLSLTTKIAGSGELTIGVMDLFDETDIPIDTIGSNDFAAETPGRTLFVRVQLLF